MKAGFYLIGSFVESFGSRWGGLQLTTCTEVTFASISFSSTSTARLIAIANPAAFARERSSKLIGVSVFVPLLVCRSICHR